MSETKFALLIGWLIIHCSFCQYISKLGTRHDGAETQWKRRLITSCKRISS